MSWIVGIALFMVGIVTGFLLCGFMIMCAEDRKQDGDDDG